MKMTCTSYSVTLFVLFITNIHADLERVCQGASKKITCDTEQKIYIDTITQTKIYDTICNSYTQKDCKSDFSKTYNKCHGQQQCKISGEELEAGICTWYPRYMFLQYTCHLLGSIYKSNTEICSSTENLGCSWWYWISNIEVTKDNIERYPLCDGENIDEIGNCLTSRVNWCYGHYTCRNLITPETECFYLPFSVDIWYRCVNEYSFPDSARPPESDDNRPNTSFVSLSKGNVTKNKNTDFTNNEINIKVMLGEENRLLGVDQNGDRTFSLCAYLWNDFGASVACKHLNLSKSGRAGTIQKNKSYSQLGMRVICRGNETSLFDCIRVENTSITNACSKLGDATVQCEGQNYKGSNETLESDSGKSKLGFIAGIVVGCLVLLAVNIMIILRYIRHQKKFSNKQMREPRVMCDTSGDHSNAYVYTDVEEENAPFSDDSSNTVSKPDGSSYFVLDPKETGYNRKEGPQQGSTNTHAKEDHYASSMEGVYDVSNKNRHVIKDDVNVYSHTVDDVYDVSGNNRKEGKCADYNYQEFSLQENK